MLLLVAAETLPGSLLDTAADRTVRSPIDGDKVELHLLGVDTQHPAGYQSTKAGYQLYGFGNLYG